MKLPVDKKRTIITFLIADLVFAVCIFISCINIFLFQDFGVVQICIIGIFVFFSTFMLIMSLTRNYYHLESKSVIVVKGTKVSNYNYADVVYIDKEQSERKRTVVFVTNLGHVRYLPFDKNGKIYDSFLNKCHNLVELDELQSRFPKVKL